MPAAVVGGGDPAWLEERLTEDDSVGSPARLTANGDSALFQLPFEGVDDELSRLLTSRDLSVLDAQTVDDEWAFEVITDDRSALGDVTEGWEAAGFDHRLERVVSVDDLKTAGQYGLTDTQAETLITAHRAGYYEVPRTVGITELAKQLGISHQATSQRLRRGHGRLVASALDDGAGDSRLF
jgi:predicted DNA binding protein